MGPVGAYRGHQPYLVFGVAGENVRGAGVAGIHQMLLGQQVSLGQSMIDGHRHGRVSHCGMGGHHMGDQLRWLRIVVIGARVLSQVSVRWTL